ncbi:uncharacterized protein LOC130800862 [Amaranthus tricolor]|uniref:uncharacterized protein LOC130800862 n=1 Tax=Amaranthus tricolor TaxID=29722 RepID=UPI002584C188|nr:uncharacterized protein LOC130800862 [Amaranthus tricolor]
MGNCIETCRFESKRSIKEDQKKEKEGSKGNMGVYVKNVENNKNGVRVKMVLTKEELQWLILQLKNREEGDHGKRIEDVLQELGKGRKKVFNGNHSWRPSLDSITEISEVLEMNK